MYCDFEEYVKNRKPDKLSMKNLVDPSLEKPYDPEAEAEADDDDDDDDF